MTLNLVSPELPDQQYQKYEVKAYGTFRKMLVAVLMRGVRKYHFGHYQPPASHSVTDVT